MLVLHPPKLFSDNLSESHSLKVIASQHGPFSTVMHENRLRLPFLAPKSSS